MPQWFYAIGVGLQRGVFESWEDCEPLIGKDRLKYPKYRKFPTREEADAFVAEYARTPLVWKNGANYVASKRSLEKDLQELQQQHARLRRRTDVDVANLREEADRQRVILAEQHLPAALKEDMRAIIENIMRIQPANYNLVYNGNNCIVYVHGAFYKGGPNDVRGGIGVCFGIDSPLNVSMTWRGVAPTKISTEVLAATVALKVAKLAGIKNLNIHTNSKYVINQAGGGTRGNDMVKNLRSAAEILDNISWITGNRNDEGMKIATELGNQGSQNT